MNSGGVEALNTPRQGHLPHSQKKTLGLMVIRESIDLIVFLQELIYRSRGDISNSRPNLSFCKRGQWGLPEQNYSPSVPRQNTVRLQPWTLKPEFLNLAYTHFSKESWHSEKCYSREKQISNFTDWNPQTSCILFSFPSFLSSQK